MTAVEAEVMYEAGVLELGTVAAEVNIQRISILAHNCDMSKYVVHILIHAPIFVYIFSPILEIEEWIVRFMAFRVKWQA